MTIDASSIRRGKEQHDGLKLSRNSRFEIERVPISTSREILLAHPQVGLQRVALHFAFSGSD